MSCIERKLRERGFRSIAGTDEVGRGCLAGPVVAAAVILDEDPTIVGVNDSKKLRFDERLALFHWITARARAVAIGVIEPNIIDNVNILRASKLAMRHAVENLDVRPEVLVLDAVVLESVEMPQLAVIAGDQRSVSVAAASIVAKVYRDLLMESYHERYPEYDFAHNRGYGTELHLEALKRLGPSPIHRRSFLSVSEATLFDS
jgi:ribonuclease HII